MVYTSVSIKYITGYNYIEVDTPGSNNGYGSSVGSSMVTAYTFTFTEQDTWACVGFVYDVNGISAWPLNQDVRSQSMVLCSDNSYFNIQEVYHTTIQAGSTFTISVDIVANTFVIQEVDGPGKYVGSFDNLNYLFYTIQIMDMATITFDKTIQVAIPAQDNFNWVYLTSHQNILVDSAAAQVSANTDIYMNIFGENFNLNSNCGFEFNVQRTDERACVGFVEVAAGTVNNLPLNQDIHDLSHVVCYDGTQFQTSSSLVASTGSAALSSSASASWTVQVDNTAHTITFTQDGGAVFVANFDASNELHSTVQFALDGLVQFTPTVVNSAGCPQIGAGTQYQDVVVSQTAQQAVYNNTYYDLGWLSALSSSEITVDTTTGQVQSTGSGTHNIIGSSFTEVEVTSFTFTLAYSASYTCMGFIEQESVGLVRH